MQFPNPLHSGTLIKRYKRFLADVKLDDTGETICAHCPNTGSMKTCAEPGSKVYLSHNPSPERKLKYTWELTETNGGFIGVNTHLTNRIVEEALSLRTISEISAYPEFKREVKFGKNSRMDFHLTGESGHCFLEVKNTTLLHDGKVLFPDAVSERALKHILELKEAKISKQAERCVILFVVNRPEGSHFRPAWDIHRAYAQALKENLEWVEVLAYRTVATSRDIRLVQPVEVDLSI